MQQQAGRAGQNGQSGRKDHRHGDRLPTRRRNVRWIVCQCFVLLGLAWHPLACAENQVDSRTGELLLLTFNVAGLPEGASSSHPEANTPQMSPLLNGYDLVLVQEDFWYHAELSADAIHPYQSAPWSAPPILQDLGDGLNRFSRSSFGDLTRVAWPNCHGTLECASDCLASKGFSYATHEIDPGLFVDVYNVHMEAGGCPEDEAIREESIQVLLDVFDQQSSGRAIVVAGDWNLHSFQPIDLVLLERLTNEGGFQDACWAVSCGETNIDRIFVRAGPDLDLEVVDWFLPAEFVDAMGDDLSDHEPVAAAIKWTERL